MNTRIILTGFMGTGKTTIGRWIAQRLGMPFCDLDEVIQQTTGRSIPTIFAQEGESGFRRIESQALRNCLTQSPLVLATGGGTVLSPENRALMEKSGLLVCLTCSEEVLAQRLNGSAASERPLLKGQPLLDAIRNLLKARHSIYEQIFWQIDTSYHPPEVIAEDIITLAQANVLKILYPGGEYPVLIGRQVSRLLPHLLRSLHIPPSTTLALISSETIAPLHAARLIDCLNGMGFQTHLITVPDGESVKSLETATHLYQALLDARIDRSSLVLALGGGVIGDLAGFVASTYMRGLPLVQVPTSLLAMVDASLGGKTGVNLPQGKNLVGTFKQPLAVIVDPEFLRTLPEVELRAGLAEVIKHGIIDDPALFNCLETQFPDLSSLISSEDFPTLLTRAIAVKAKIIQADPYEKDLRAVLNLGHTIGHAVETLSAYTLRHGEAVSIGLAVEALLAHQIGLANPETVQRIHTTLARWGLPITSCYLDFKAILAVIQHDKKHTLGKLRWALPRSIGDVVLTTHVTAEDLQSAITSIRSIEG